MNDMEMHLRKVIEMSKFRLSRNFNYLSEAAKVKFIRKHEYHARQYTRLFVGVFRPVYDFLYQVVEDVIKPFVNEIARILGQIDWSKQNEHSQGNDEHLQVLRQVAV